ncbi:MAG: hypothetical protein HFH68_14200 [Lachnospiraceae bacterium]|nr:hypothetical protein [Lachnospiraceae bacterium]
MGRYCNGLEAIEDTYASAFSEWKFHYKYPTEFVMVLNWKLWEHYKSNAPYAELYGRLFSEASDYAEKNLKGAKLEYFIKITG